MPASLPIDLDTAVLIAPSLIGLGLFLCVVWHDRQACHR